MWKNVPQSHLLPLLMKIRIRYYFSVPSEEDELLPTATNDYNCDLSTIITLSISGLHLLKSAHLWMLPCYISLCLNMAWRSHSKFK